MFLLYCSLNLSPPIVPIFFSYPGSLKYGSSTNINDWIDIKTCKIVDVFGFQVSLSFVELHVPNKDKHTFPFWYKFGLNLTVSPPVVLSNTFGSLFGYPFGKHAWNSNNPLWYGVLSGPAIKKLNIFKLVLLNLIQIVES